ncbi:aromatic-ring-hydroxylating dioxygenase subunit beta [Marinobacterium rhizophilum]|uniref:Aromatic-ring-hydroxylating dioxygenase subunit beta n=1 Tax=Marinobacterium rhizophilum TaxID=420402 RepID=A0ABY5HK01_9GAMM|nr:aromatic-ring-hydroxylating dioxygenase subunit beta [Marinobacterium rhizophilum]UTW11286.1 aromatic-ring-hydroxylating dioxygenase subunit beta [Marinobacterium rhizophilum]
MNIETLVAENNLMALTALVADFNSAYAQVLDDGSLKDWPQFFTADAVYKITSRENFDQGRPVGLVYCDGLSMIKDRALAIDYTAMFAPRYLRHFITNTRVEKIESNELVVSANYMLMQTLQDKPEARVHQVGKYMDRFSIEGGRLQLKQRICVYDNTLLDNSLVYPV